MNNSCSLQQKQPLKDIPSSIEQGVRLFQDDALIALKEIPTESIDLIFADPPYNLSNDGYTCRSGKRVSVNKGDWDKSNGIENDFAFHSEWITECKRILKPNGTIWISGTYHSIFACGFALQLQGWHIINDISWLKPNASPNLACRMFTASHETLIWAKKAKTVKHFFNYEVSKNHEWAEDKLKSANKQMRSVWSIPPPAKKEKEFGKHPTQKPEKLLERIILTCTKEGDLVLDPFCGSGTTGVAAVRFNRGFIGIDQNSDYLEIALKRIIKEQNS